uniref:Uncharacterized protein n=1 Tax=Anguilla anguilla TaxID=7936 RepID=A0A0E9RTI2_ANGAN
MDRCNPASVETLKL